MEFSFIDKEIVTIFEKLGVYNRLQNILSSPPAYTTLRINTLAEDAGRVLDAVQKELQKRHPAFEFDVSIHPVIADLIVISSLNHGPVERAQVEKEVIVDRFCGMAVLRGADVFASGLLAMSAGIRKSDKISLYVDIDGVCLRGSFPPYKFKRFYIGNGISMCSREEVYCGSTLLSGVGVDVTEPLYISPKLNNFLPHLVFAQNLPSCLVAHVLDPQPGETVLDMCAAPGGKTCHIGSLMRSSGTLIAVDKAKKKIDVLQKNLDLSGCQFAQVFCYDSTKLVSDTSDVSRTLADGPPYAVGSFDRILLDAPCSALGQRPSLRNPMTSKELASYPALQRKLLSSAVRLLREGGTLVYSTCTFTSSENEGQMSWLLGEHEEMSLQPQGKFHVNKNSDIRTLYPDSSLSDHQLSMLQSFHPAFIAMDTAARTCDTDTIGFFIAKLRKGLS